MESKVDLWALSDLCTPWCIHVAVTLQIPDHIDAGITTIEGLAKASSADPDSLRRVLRHLTFKGVFEEPVPGTFALNEPARQLLHSMAKLGMDLNGIGGRMAYAWSSLLPAVKTGTTAYHTVFGLSFWEDLQAHPEIRVSFDDLMGPPGHGMPDANVEITGGWESVRTVVDVGGGTGALLDSILSAQPGLHGTLVDLPQTVARANLSARLTVVGQSFFDPLPSGADLYLMKNVLADWADRDALLLLKRCADAARPSGRVLILGGVEPDSPFGPSPELLMMVLVGGKSRTLSQFRTLAGAAGLEILAAGKQPSGRFAVECRPDS